MLRKRLISFLFLLPLLVGVCIAAYKLGPNPDHAVTEVKTQPTHVSERQKAKANDTQNPHLFELFGMYHEAVAKGRVQITPKELLDSIEDKYKQRGYQKIEGFNEQEATKRRRGNRQADEGIPIKFFQRDDAEGMANISATGTDADYISNETAVEPYTFSTLVVAAADGGAEWATYRIGIDRKKIAQVLSDADADFPGFDPVGIPRPPGLQRVYAYTSGAASMAIYKSRETDSALMLRYLREMPRSGWHLDSDATSTANKVATGVMCFTQGTRSCLIWVTPGKDDGTTNVTISSH